MYLNIRFCFAPKSPVSLYARIGEIDSLALMQTFNLALMQTLNHPTTAIDQHGVQALGNEVIL